MSYPIIKEYIFMEEYLEIQKIFISVIIPLFRGKFFNMHVSSRVFYA